MHRASATTKRDQAGPSPRRFEMRTYNTPHTYYCGVDLHARSLFVHVLDDKGYTRLERDIAASPATFLDTVKPYREGLVVGCECMFAWYWLADLCGCWSKAKCGSERTRRTCTLSPYPRR
jgi:hypothetical protein